MRLLIASFAAIALLSAAENKLGKPLTLKEATPLATLLAHPDDFVGKTVQVRGTITAVCQMMGCWMDVADDQGKRVHIQVPDGEIVFPKDSAGKTAIAEGKFTRTELTKDEAVARAKEEAEERGTKFDPASVKGPVTIYQIQGSGAVIVSQ
jgi:hypothetical protein